MFDDVTSMLEKKFGCHSFVLYGSHASQQANAASDVDICAFRRATEEIRCGKLWNTHLLDIWIYPDHNLEQLALKFIRLRNGVVLKEKDGIATKCLDLARKRFAEGPPAIAEWDLEVKKVWIEKTLVRIQAFDPESNYRRAWLLCSLLENYFEFRKLWYLGPKESMSWLEQNDSNAFALFSKSLAPGAPLTEIKNLAYYVLGNGIDKPMPSTSQQKLQEQAETWLNRAAMAYQQKKNVLADQALSRMWAYQKDLATLNGTPEPPLPEAAEEFFKDESGPAQGADDSPSLVPKRPYPGAGSGEIALPLPDPKDG